MLVILQCLDCKYFPTLKLSYEKEFKGSDSCSQYPVAIPSYVENGTENCPKFEEEEK